MKNLQELLSKPVWQMTGEEFIFLSKHASRQTETQPQPITDTERKYVYGILGIAKLFGCSLPTANRIKKSGKIDKAITQIGRKIIVDVELALELAGKVMRKHLKSLKYMILSLGHWVISAHPSAKPKVKKRSMYRLS